MNKIAESTASTSEPSVKSRVGHGSGDDEYSQRHQRRVIGRAEAAVICVEWSIELNKIIAVTLLVASTAVFPVAAPALANSSIDRLCGPDAPEGYKRPGGYCEQIDSNKSLNDGHDGCSWEWLPLSTMMKQTSEPVLVAANCYDYEDIYVY